MKLDFSKLNKLSIQNITKIPPEKPATEIVGDLEGIIPLQRQAEANKAELERSRVVYAEYQSNIKASSQLQTEILKGLKQGEDIHTLFLKAVQAISLMTSNKLFYTQSKETLIAIYGKGVINKND